MKPLATVSWSCSPNEPIHWKHRLVQLSHWLGYQWPAYLKFITPAFDLLQRTCYYGHTAHSLCRLGLNSYTFAATYVLPYSNQDRTGKADGLYGERWNCRCCAAYEHGLKSSLFLHTYHCYPRINLSAIASEAGRMEERFIL